MGSAPNVISGTQQPRALVLPQQHKACSYSLATLLQESRSWKVSCATASFNELCCGISLQMTPGDADMEETVADNPQMLFQTVSDPSDTAMEGVEIQETNMGLGISGSNESKSSDPLTGSYTWTVENWNALVVESKQKIYSERFEVGTYFWRLLIFPKGNKANFLSVYLDAPEASYTPLQMSPKAGFKLVLINQQDPSRSYIKETQHTFTPQETDWGFTQFIPLDELQDPRKGFLKDDTIELRVEIQVQKDERCAYDSRAETGHVGLKNQGATCYMNSLLQYLFHLPYFRKAAYHMPTSEVDEPSKSIPLALQSLFFKLQYSKTSVSTKDLTKSFGWGTYDAFMQHDVQELNRVLCEKLEEKMKGTKVEKVINELFEGYTYNFIECVNVEYKSTRKESFMDLQLDVKGCNNIYDSFAKYTEVEMLEGQNQYKVEGLEQMQDAKKGVLFESFPPVLQLQLKRFEYDFQRDTMVKINDRYEFFEELDLDYENGRLLAPTADRRVCNHYKLHSVLVHSGGVHGGHYYAFIRPDGKTWLKFDDDRVTREDKKKALDEQFGGEDENPTPTPGYNHPPIKITKYSNAYMLVYIRTSDWDRMLCEVTKDDIADHLLKRLEAEQAEKERRQKDKAEAHLYCHLRVATDEDIKAQVGKTRFFDLVDHEDCQSYRVQKKTRFAEFKKMMEEKTGVPVEQQRYWTWARRQNNTFRPSKPLTPEEEEWCLMDLRDHREQGPATNKAALMDLKLFLEVIQPDKAGKVDKLNKNEILLFFKYYEPREEKLMYAGRRFAHKMMKMGDLFAEMCRLANLPENTELEAFEEIKYDPSVMCELIDRRHVLQNQAQLEDGDIICFQKVLSPEEEKQYKHPRVKDYLQYIRNRRLVNFRKLEDPKEEGVKIELLREHNYDDVCIHLAEQLGLADATKLRLTQHNAYSHQPQRNPIKYRALNTLESMLQHANHTNEVLYYEVLDLPLPELEKLKTLKVAFHDHKGEMVSEHLIRLPKDSCVKDVLHKLKLNLPPKFTEKPFRLIEVFNSKVYKVCEEKDHIDNINDMYWTLRAEVVQEEEREIPKGYRLIHVYHFHCDSDNTNSQVTCFGDPFFLRIHEEERLAEIKQRIKQRLAVPDEEMAKWKFAFVSIRGGPEYLDDNDIVAQRFAKSHSVHASESNYLGLDHEDKAPKRNHTLSRYSTYERPVKIYN